jgi:putative ABC transport system permease protein
MRDRFRAARATISSAPWRRAPVLMLRRPGVLATVAGACAVTAASLAAVPLFLSSVGTASVALQASERCPRDTGAMRSFSATPQQVTARSEDPFRPVADQLGPSNHWVRLELATLAGNDASRSTPASLLTRDDALDHVEVLEGSDGPGVWISDRGAEQTGLGVGDLATVGEAQAPVVGIYRDLSGTSVDDFWCSNADLVLLEARGADLVRPPPLVLADEQTFATLMDGMGAAVADGAWEVPLRDGQTVADTKALVDDLACGADGQEASDLEWCADGRPRVPRSSGGFSREPVEARSAPDFVERFLHSHLPFVTKRSTAIQTSVGGGVWPVAGFAALAGVGLVAAASSLWFDRRRREVTLLTVRGVSPAGLGAKAVLELSLAAAAGVLAGIGLAYLTVVWLGPSSVLEPSAVGDAALAGLAALAVSALTIGSVVAWRVRTHEARRQRHLHLAVLPWELGLVAMTVVSYRRLGDWGIPVGRGAEVSRVDVWGLLFPVLFLVTAVALLSRVLALALRPLRAASRSWPTPLYLAVRRVARYRVAVIGLVAASAVAAGVLAYAATMNQSLDATLQTKARTFVGSDLALRLAADEELPAELAARATDVQSFGKAWVEAGSRRRNVTVLAIDPDTFEPAVFWDESFASAPLADVLEQLEAPRAGAQVPAVVVGMDLQRSAEVGIEDAGTARLTVAPVASVEAFPGMKRSEPTVFVSASALAGLDIDDGMAEVWIGGDREASLAVLEAAGTAFTEGRNRSDVADGSSFLTVSWTFGFMRSLGIAAGFLVLGGVAIYLDARRRDRLLGYTFMRRMGLTGREHRRALVVELSASVLVGCWGGLAIALVAAWFAHQQIDPVPGFPPAPLLRPAMVLVTALAVVSLVIVGVAAVLAQRRIERDDAVEVLRAGA